MKTDLATSIITVIAGVIIAYFVTNLFTPTLEDVSFKVLDESVSSTLTDPNNEIFNYRSVNPTVEVFVGKCEEFNEKGECIDGNLESEETTEDDENVNPETPETPVEEENGGTN